MTGSNNIKPAFETLKNHSGIKAFVFKNEIDHKCSSLVQNCTEIINSCVPLYRFVNNSVIIEKQC